MASTAYSADQLQETPNVSYFPAKMKNNDQNDHDDHDNHDYNNNYRVRARTRERESFDQYFEINFKSVRDAFEDVFGRAMPKFIFREMTDMMDDLQIKPCLIAEVIEYTACAPRPSWAYARAVIYRCRLQKGIVDGKGFRDDLRGRSRDCNPVREEIETEFDF